jgi:hypothetical protein
MMLTTTTTTIRRRDYQRGERRARMLGMSMVGESVKISWLSYWRVRRGGNSNAFVVVVIEVSEER